MPFLALAFMLGVAALLIAAPHVLVAAIVPIFAGLPMIKALFIPWIGPLKDAVVVAVAVGLAALLVKRRRSGEPQRGDHVALGAAVALLGLYVVNLGGSFDRANFGSAWMHGVRLAAEPIILLALGLLVSQGRKAFRWGMISLIATAVGVALIGLWQQRVGEWGLVDLGYEWDRHVRTFNGRLRSFGTLDDAFAYAALLLFGLVGVAFYMRRGVLAASAGAIVVAGLYVGYVRTALMILVAIVGLWLARKGLTQVAFLVILASAVAGVVVLIMSTEATENRVVRADQNTYLTINGRTDTWRNVLRGPQDWLIGRGVGDVGTAAERAEFGVYRTAEEAAADLGEAVDSGYLAAVADTGMLGLIVLGALFARLGMLGVRAIQAGRTAGWVAVSLLAVILLDAVTRASFNGFPTAFLGLLLIGLALNASEQEERETLRSAS